MRLRRPPKRNVAQPSRFSCHPSPVARPTQTDRSSPEGICPPFSQRPRREGRAAFTPSAFLDWRKRKREARCSTSWSVRPSARPFLVSRVHTRVLCIIRTHARCPCAPRAQMKRTRDPCTPRTGHSRAAYVYAPSILAVAARDSADVGLEPIMRAFFL